MTKSWSVQNDRFNYAKDQADQYANDTYDTYNSWKDDFLNNYLKSYANNLYGGDWHAIHKSGGGWAKRGTELGRDFINEYEKYVLDKLNEEWNDLYGQTDWQKSYLPSDVASNYVNTYLDDEYNNALEQLERAYKRGTLNDSQYDNAISKMSQHRNAANSTYGQIDDSLMDTYSQDLQTKANEYANDLQSWDLSDYDTITSANWKTGLNDHSANMMNNLTSNIDQMFLDISGGNPIFDVNSIIGNAKTASGIYNTKSDNLMQAIEDEEQKNKEQKIGLGNQGMF
jgi:hypothetical protein